jgi:hypothetical protein
MAATHDDRRARPAHAGPPRRVRAAISTDRATAGLTAYRFVVAPEHVVFVKGVLEASDGLACLFAERGGDLCIASPEGRARELRELLADLAAELGGTPWEIEAPRDQGAPQTSPPPR